MRRAVLPDADPETHDKGFPFCCEERQAGGTTATTIRFWFGRDAAKALAKLKLSQ